MSNESRRSQSRLVRVNPNPATATHSNQFQGIGDGKCLPEDSGAPPTAGGLGEDGEAWMLPPQRRADLLRGHARPEDQDRLEASSSPTIRRTVAGPPSRIRALVAVIGIPPAMVNSADPRASALPPGRRDRVETVH